MHVTEMDSHKEKIEITPKTPQPSSPRLATPTQLTPKSHHPICPPMGKACLLNQTQSDHKRLLDFLKARPSKDWINGLYGKSTLFIKRIGSFRGVKKSPGFELRVPFVRKINWKAVITECKNWCMHPMNMALLAWFFFVAAGVLLLLLLMTGALNGMITKSSERKRWIEITNQILNALFTIICLYQHPKLCHHLLQVIRWRSTDASALRNVYCKNGGSAGPNERAHLAFVVTLFHITCFAQYVYCSLFWIFSLKTRPDWAVNLFMGLGLAMPITAGLYMIYGPLGKKYTMPEPILENDLECQVLQSDQNLDLTRSPVWIGGLFNFWDDLTVACLSLFCTCCVFGWNMERLGFGNMYVHIFTFLLLCMAPFWVFNVSALMINNEALRYVVGITGILLSFLGLLYGGYWRTQMRKRFRLPSNPFCCGYVGLSDFIRWLFCSSCALAQEVRTGNFYEIEEGELCMKERKEEETKGMKPALAPLERERSTIMVPAAPVLIHIGEHVMLEKS